MGRQGFPLEGNGMAKPVLGVFDSGVGGLTVLKELKQSLPYIDFLYLGDFARVPYGQKSRNTLVKYTHEAMEFFSKRQVDMAVIACNTASAVSLEEVSKSYPFPVLGVIDPIVQKLTQSAYKKVAVLATQTTIRSEAYLKAIHQKLPALEVSGQACPLFVPLAEEGLWDDPITVETARRYLEPLNPETIDAWILGCTHYPLLIPSLSKVLGEKAVFLTPAQQLAEQIRKHFAEGSGTGKTQYFSTDEAGAGSKKWEAWLGEKPSFTKIDLPL